MEIEIEKNIPIPGSSGLKYPFDKMEVGDSFYVELKGDEKAHSVQSNLMTNAKGYAIRRKLDWQFISRKTELGIRVWRIK